VHILLLLCTKTPSSLFVNVLNFCSSNSTSTSIRSMFYWKHCSEQPYSQLNSRAARDGSVTVMTLFSNNRLCKELFLTNRCNGRQQVYTSSIYAWSWRSVMAAYMIHIKLTLVNFPRYDTFDMYCIKPFNTSWYRKLLRTKKKT